MKSALTILENIIPDFQEKSLKAPFNDKEDIFLRNMSYMRLWTIASELDNDARALHSASESLSRRFKMYSESIAQNFHSHDMPLHSSYVGDVHALHVKIRDGIDQVCFLITVLEGRTTREVFLKALSD
jgi:hypothetical protein